jgi:hypothetical protein
LDLFVPLCIGRKETPAIRSSDGHPQPFPLLHRTVETKEVLYPLLSRESWLPIGAIKINKEKLVSSYENVFELKVTVKKTCLVKLADKKTGRSNRFSLQGKGFGRGHRNCFLKKLNQIYGTWDFYRKKISLIEGKENAMMDGTEGGDRGNATGPDLLRQSEFLERSRPK